MRISTGFKIGCTMVLVASLCACELEPTKIVETQKRELVQVTEKAQKPLELSEEVAILDARSSFDYGLDRVRNSYNFSWENLAEDPHTGEVLRDKHQAAVRLSLLGLTPVTPVVVLGYGPLGQGEEGRLAWTLLYLGFQDVQVSAISSFRKSMTREPSPNSQNVPRWQVNPREELQVNREQFLDLTNKVGGGRRVLLLDVRSEKEYLAQSSDSAAKPLPAVTTLNIEWKQFYTAQGRPDLHFKKKLIALGVHPEDRIIVISNHGVRSGAAAYALLALGYPHVQNFTAGREGLK